MQKDILNIENYQNPKRYCRFTSTAVHGRYNSRHRKKSDFVSDPAPDGAGEFERLPGS